MLSTLIAPMFLFVALVITALEPSLTARSIRLRHAAGIRSIMNKHAAV